MRAHRPFWVLRHRVTGVTKTSTFADSEDGMWQVVLTDGSSNAEGDLLVERLAEEKRKDSKRAGK
jgi:hypothetical protein